MTINDITSMILFTIGISFVIFNIGQIIYYYRKMTYWKNKSDQLRLEIFKKYGVWIDRPPPL